MLTVPAKGSFPRNRFRIFFEPVKPFTKTF